MEVYKIHYISITSHKLAKELLSKPDGFLTASMNNKEYFIENLQRKSSYANIDDSVLYWTLNLDECREGNIKSTEESIENQTKYN